MAKVFVFFLLITLMTSQAYADSSQVTVAPEGMVLIPEGPFEMGSRRSLRELNPTEIFQADRHMLGPEDPAHEVYTAAYYIDKNETTNAAYKKFIASTHTRSPNFLEDEKFNHPDQPIVGVNWKEARGYCRWAGKRLPTEAEWEKAGRGQAPTLFPWGNVPPDSTRANFNEEQGKTTKVGSYEPGKSAYGVYDLSGNVAEWVSDWHYPEYYLFSPKKNPRGPDKGTYKVIRGGNWRNNGPDVRLTYRNATTPSIRSNSIGFRCVKDIGDRPIPED